MYINVQFIDMDTMIPEQINQNDDGGYTIFLNSRLSYETICSSYLHAIKHIQNNDFEKSDVQEIETAAHCEQKLKTI